MSDLVSSCVEGEGVSFEADIEEHGKFFRSVAVGFDDIDQGPQVLNLIVIKEQVVQLVESENRRKSRIWLLRIESVVSFFSL